MCPLRNPLNRVAPHLGLPQQCQSDGSATQIRVQLQRCREMGLLAVPPRRTARKGAGTLDCLPVLAASSFDMVFWSKPSL
jgi:hypothetical protein